MHTLILILTGLTMLVVARPLMSATEILPWDPRMTTIQTILQERIDKAKKGVGIVVGIVEERGTMIVGHGYFEPDRTREVNGDTVFEIGSITKVFTSLALADLVERGKARLEDPISKYLPASVKVPTRNGKEITLADLATHTSGLPRMPDNFAPKDPGNPYADYTVEQMDEFLSGYRLPRDIGAEYEYSNYGAALLGRILALRAGTNYEALIEQRICRPLAMTNTAITLDAKLRARLAPGHDLAGRPVANWDLPTFAGAGALRSTVGDLLKFAAANLGLTKSGLEPAMELEQTPRHDAGAATMRIGLGWHIAKKYEAELIWHNGATGGYHSFIGFDKKKKLGVVVLANSENSIDDIGFHLLEAKYELAQFAPATNRSTIRLEPKVLDAYVGRYQLASQAFFNVRREENRLLVQLTGQAYFEVVPTTETNFFYEVVDAQLTFHKNDQGRVAELVLHQNGVDQTAKKTSDEAPRDRAAVRLDPKIYDDYTGQYELAPGAVFTIRREGDRLLAQLTGQPAWEVFPESETHFFYKVVDAQLTFQRGESGKATGLVLHQNGLDQEAKRIK